MHSFLQTQVGGRTWPRSDLLFPAVERLLSLPSHPRSARSRPLMPTKKESLDIGQGLLHSLLIRAVR